MRARLAPSRYRPYGEAILKGIFACEQIDVRYTCPMGVTELFFSLPTREVMQAIWAVLYSRRNKADDVRCVRPRRRYPRYGFVLSGYTPKIVRRGRQAEGGGVLYTYIVEECVL